MMSPFTFFLPLATFLFVLAGCETPPPAKSSTPKMDVLVEAPRMQVGDSWVLDTPAGIRNAQVIQVNADGSFVTEWSSEGRQVAHRIHFDQNWSRVKEIDLKSGRELPGATPPAQHLNFPLFVGKEWSDQYAAPQSPFSKVPFPAGTIHEIKNSYRVTAFEPVTVKAGTFQAFKIVQELTNLSLGPKGKSSKTYWYAPELKRIVKSDPGWEKSTEVVSYTLAKKAAETLSIHLGHGSAAAVAPPGPPAVRMTSPAEADVRWALVVGVSNYRDSRIPALRYAAADAAGFYEWLVSPKGGRFTPSRVRLLTNQEATSGKIKESLFNWLREALEEDLVVIFFAGHGSPDSPDSNENLFLLPYDADYDHIASTSFPMWDIETALKRFIKARKVIVMADACHASGVGQAYDVARRASRGMQVNSIHSALQNLSQVGDGVCILSASDQNQFSQEGQKWGGGHGVFTYYLLQGLTGEADYNRDRTVTLGEIIPYLSEKVRRATGNAQTPTVAGRFDPALSIAKNAP